MPSWVRQQSNDPWLIRAARTLARKSHLAEAVSPDETAAVRIAIGVARSRR